MPGRGLIPLSISKLTGRIFVLVSVAALLPLLLAGYFAYSQIVRTLETSSFAHLREDAKGFGMQIVADIERIAGSDVAALERSGQSQSNGVIAYWELSASGKAQNNAPQEALSLPMDALALRHLNRGLPQLLSLPVDGEIAHVLLRKSGATPQRYTAMLLDRELLWGPSSYLSYRAEYCVVSSSKSVLFCTESMDAGEARQLVAATETAGDTLYEWTRGGESKLSATWELFLEAEFAHDSVHVVATLDKASLFAPVQATLKLIPPIFLLSLVLIAWLSFRLVRRNMTPLQALTDAADAFRQGQLETRVTIPGDDEFGRLGKAFNAMAEGLEDRIERMRSLASLDELVVEGSSIDDIVEEFLAQALRLSGVDAVVVLMPDLDNYLNSLAYVHDGKRHSRINLSSIVLSRINLPNTSGKPDMQTVDGLPNDVEGILGELGIHYFASMPIVARGETRGGVLFCSEQRGVVNPDRLAKCISIVDRLAVGLADAEREVDLYRQAHYDELTQLPNRQLFKDRLSQAIVQAKRSNHSGALLFLDLDRFKQVNDVYGHSTGDLLLREAANRIVSITDTSTTVARLGGDEFVVLLPHFEDQASLERQAKSLVDNLKLPFLVDGVEHVLGASVGVALFPEDGNSTEMLLKNADFAMYGAKESGKNRYEFFQKKLNEDSRRRLHLENDLRHYLEDDRLEVQFQPQFDLQHRSLSGAEVLLRWNHDELGAISPSEFIPIAEESNIIVELGHWVINRACEELAEILKLGHHPGRMAINVSAKQLSDGQLVEQIRGALRDHRINPGYIEIEITESIMANESGDTHAILGALRKAGVAISMDDFGTGFSSLGILRTLPFDSLKIDRSFVSEIGKNKASENICRAIIEMAHALHKTVVAEGIESEEQARFLAHHRCEIGQGYLFSQPLDREQFRELVARQREHTLRRKTLKVS